MTAAERRRRFYNCKQDLYKARSRFTDSLLWRWYARKGGPIEALNLAIDALDRYGRVWLDDEPEETP